ncbi:toll/interleukin-1 receptor-like protein [Bidens hawaiensis]|uniref:toll/interleukin-1 receptor-like protein n=1 Tax=Bidens hawaiensis TaxID=980011 RepID=UPI0040494AF5
MASTLSSAYSPSDQKIYDVCLSYHDLSSHTNFVDDMVYALDTKGITTRMVDISIVGGRFSYLSQGIYNSMQLSSMAVVVCCKNYVTSPRCLDELVKIMELRKAIEGGLNVLPVYYDVDPFELRNSEWHFEEIHRRTSSTSQFGNAYCEYSNESVTSWRQAILELTNLQGLTLKLQNIPNWDYLDFVEEIAKTVMRNLGLMQSLAKRNARSSKVTSGKVNTGSNLAFFHLTTMIYAKLN